MESIESKYELDISEALRSMEKLHDAYGVLDKQLTQTGGRAVFAKATTEQARFNQSLGQSIQITRQVEAVTRSYRAELDKQKGLLADLNKRHKELADGNKYKGLEKVLAEVRQRMQAIEKSINEAGDEVDKFGRKGANMGGNFSRLQGIIAGVFAVDKIIEFGQHVLEITGKFERYEEVLTNALGNRSAAQQGLQMITEFAATTPFQVDELTESFLKLVNRGIEPTRQQMRQIGDLAASQGKSFDQLTEAILDAQTGEFERLKEFGIRATKSGDQVTVAFKGVSTTVKNTSTDISNAILKFGDLRGVVGSTAVISKTLEGQISNLGDSYDRLLLALGNSGVAGGFKMALAVGGEFLSLVTDLIEKSPVDNLRQQQAELNGLVGALVLANDNEAVRSNLITEINQKYPEFLGRLDAESISTDILSQRLATVNKLYEQKIRIALGQERIQKVQESLTKTIRQQTEALQDLAKASGKSLTELEKLNPAQRLALAKKIAAGQSKVQAVPGGGGLTLAPSAGDYTATVLEQSTERQNKLQKELNGLLGENAVRQSGLTKTTVDGLNQQIKQIKEKIKLKKIDRQLGEEEIKRLQAEKNRAQGIVVTPVTPKPVGAKAATKKENDGGKALIDEYKTLIKAQEEYQSEAAKLIAEYGKEKLELLTKDGTEYIDAKAKLDIEEVELERRKIESLLQIARSTKTRKNGADQLEVVADTSVTLAKDAPDLDRIYQERKRQIQVEADRQKRVNQIRSDRELLELGQLSKANELALFDSKWEEKLLIEEKGNEKYAELVRQRDSARNDLIKTASLQEIEIFDEKWVGILKIEEAGSKKYALLVKKRDKERTDLLYDQLINEQKTIEAIENYRIDARVKGRDKTGTEFMKTNELDKLENSIISSENQIFGLQKQNNPNNTPEILRLEAFVKALKDKRKEIEQLSPQNRDIWDLLGISKSFKDETEREKFLAAVRSIGDSIQAATQSIVEAAESRIAALNEEISTREEQLQTELERRKEGQANNADVLKAELNDLKRQKAEEEAVRRRAVKVQQELDLISTTSTNAVTVANLIDTTVKYFKANAGIPFVGVALAVASAAALLAAIQSFKAKAQAISRLEKGGRVDVGGKSHQEGGHRIEGTNIEVEGGEHVVNRLSSQLYDEELTALNSNDPRKAFLSLMKKTGFGLPPMLIANHKQVVQQSLPATTAQAIRLDTLEGIMSEVLTEIKKKPPVLVGLGDGKVLREEGNKTTITDYGKK